MHSKYFRLLFLSLYYHSAATSRLTLCEPLDCSMSGSSALHYLSAFAQIHVHWVSDANLTISYSTTPFSCCLQSFPASGSFPMSQTLIHGPNLPGSSAISFFTALDFTFTTRHIHNWASFSLWSSCFILSGAISNCPLLFPSSILDTFQLGGLIFWCHTFLSFRTVHEVLLARILEWFTTSSSRGPHFVRTLHYDLSVLGGPAWCGSLRYTSPFPRTSLWWWRGFYHYHLISITNLVRFNLR